MASNPTKILLYDLDPELYKLIDSLKTFQGTYASINDRLMDLTPDTFSEEVQKVVDDLIAGFQDGGVLTIQRIENLKKVLEEKDAELSSSMSELAEKDVELEALIQQVEAKIATSGFGAVNTHEKFTYDPEYGNVVKHEMTGDKNTTVDYQYANLAEGKLDKSIQTFVDADGATVTITKTYTYDANENITDIATVTTVTPAAPTA